MCDDLTLRRAQRGDPAAFEQLMTPLEGGLWRLCCHYLPNRQDAQDALQETMLKIWRALPDFRGQSALTTWAYRLCVNCCLDQLRRQKSRVQTQSADEMREQGFDPVDLSPLPEETVEQAETRARLRACLDQLNPEQRTALLLCAVEGRSYEETAAITGVGLGTVKSRVARARGRLAELMKRGEQNAVSRVQPSERRAKL